MAGIPKNTAKNSMSDFAFKLFLKKPLKATFKWKSYCYLKSRLNFLNQQGGVMKKQDSSKKVLKAQKPYINLCQDLMFKTFFSKNEDILFSLI